MFNVQNTGSDGLNVLLLLSLAASLSLPDAYTIAGALFAIVGLFYLAKRLMMSRSIFEPHLSGKLCLIFMAYAFICVGIQFWHDAPISHYEMYIPFLWAPLIVLAVLDGRIDRRIIWLGCFLGALFACILASYQSIIVGIDRPNGFLGNTVTFGNNALLLGSIAVAGRHDPHVKVHKSVWLLLMYLGFLFGCVSSLITLSKAGWPLIVVVLIWVTVEDFWRASRQGRLLFALAASMAVCLLPFMPLDRPISRIESAAIGTTTWLQTGEVIEGSAGPRLELWKFGLSIVFEKPWLGHGREGVIQRMQEKIAHNDVNPWIKNLTNVHNEPLQLWAEQGLIGLLGWAMIFISSALVFGRAYLQHQHAQKVVGQAGLITVAASLIFGLTDANLMLNANRQIFVLLVMTLTALVISERHITKSSS